jgi:hypothetical protein
MVPCMLLRTYIDATYKVYHQFVDETQMCRVGMEPENMSDERLAVLSVRISYRKD